MNPTCATDCSTALANMPAFKSDTCLAQTNAAEIQWLYFGLPGKSFTDIESAAEWNARLTATNDTKIVRVLVSGEKPRPAANPKEISGGRTIQLPKTHVVNADIDESNDENHEAVRVLQCGGFFQFWYATSGGKVFGGNDGMNISADADMVISKSATDLLLYQLVMTWKAKFLEEMHTSPIL